MSQTVKVVLSSIALVVMIFAVAPLASFAVSALPALLAPLSNGDGGAVFVAVAGAFGFAFVLSVPRQR
jgi:hypothetical protein